MKIEKDMNGYHWAQFMIGFYYNHGYGTESDEPKAVEWFAKSVEQGSSNAMFNLASSYNHEFGVDQESKT